MLGCIALLVVALIARPTAQPTARAMPNDNLALKRDLLELRNAAGFHWQTGLLHPDRFIAAQEKLEIDFELATPKPAGLVDTGLRLVIVTAKDIRAEGYQIAARTAHADASWIAIHTDTARLTEDLIPEALRRLDRSPAP